MVIVSWASAPKAALIGVPKRRISALFTASNLLSTSNLPVMMAEV